MQRGYTPNEILSKKFNLLDFEGEWRESLGTPDKAFSAIVWGASTNGKSSFAMQLARYLTKFGRVAYNSLEEGISHTMKMNLKRHFMGTTVSRFILLDREPFPALMERMSKHKSPDFLFIDSLQYMGINRQQYKELKELMQSKGKGLIFVSHAQGKEPKGALADFIRYDVDLKLRIEGYRMFPSGRLNGGGKPFAIWHEGAAKYWGEIK